MKRSSVLSLFLCAILWLVAICLFAFTGSIHPACYAYAGTFIPFVFALIYLYAASKLKNFGVATILNGFLLAVFLIVGEADAIMAVIFILLAVVSELLRKLYGYDTRKGTRLSFIPMAFTFYGYVSHWWTDTAGSLQAAIEEMPEGYAAKMEPVIANVPVLVVMIVLVVPVSILAMRLAEKILNK